MDDFTITNIVLFTQGALESLEGQSLTITGYCRLAEAAAIAAGKETAENPEAMMQEGKDWISGDGYFHVRED